MIDKAFDEIACQEVIYANQGYSDGLITGHAKQCREGHVLGLKKGFEHNITKTNFVFHWEISLENLRIKSYDNSYHQKVKKRGKPLISY